MYQLEISQTAHRQIKVLPIRTAERINEAIGRLAEEPRPSGVRKLAGLEGYRLRVGGYRILYKIRDESRLVTVYRVKHRREVYR